jgi:hypothetical protein
MICRLLDALKRLTKPRVIDQDSASATEPIEQAVSAKTKHGRVVYDFGTSISSHHCCS